MIQTSSAQLRCRYAVSSGFEIAGRDAALGELALLLERAASSSGLTRVDCQKPQTDTPLPYDELIEFITIERIDGLLCLLYEPRFLRIVGGAESLHLFAENIKSLISEGWADLHVEYFPGHFFLAPASEPLVIVPSHTTVTGSDGNGCG
jgi:hypothetical protein